jgi:prolyl-tRNA synthetase
VYEELLAIPVTKGRKSEGEKFAGGFFTTTTEAFIPASGRGIQGATSHCLGQNFSKMFKIQFEDDKGAKEFAWQNSWGLTTRTIGVLIMVHGDNKGLVLPPRVAPTQVGVVPIPYGKGKGDTEEIVKRANEFADELRAKGIRVQVDARDNYSPGFKFNAWEVKGVPLRIEFGPKDFAAKQCVVARRDNDEKKPVPLADLATAIPALLEQVQHDMFAKALKQREGRTTQISRWDEFEPVLNKGNMALAPYCEEIACEDNIKKKSGEKKAPNAEQEEKGFRLTGAAKSLCIPFEQPAIAADAKCFCCGKPAKKFALFGRSY